MSSRIKTILEMVDELEKKKYKSQRLRQGLDGDEDDTTCTDVSGMDLDLIKHLDFSTGLALDNDKHDENIIIIGRFY